MLYRTLHRFPLFVESGEISRCSSLDLWYFLSRESTVKIIRPLQKLKAGIERQHQPHKLGRVAANYAQPTTRNSLLTANHHHRNTSNHHRAGSAGRGMNGERAPGSALSYVEGVNRQTAGNLARQRRPQSGAVCKVQCDSNPNRRMIALPNPTVAKRQKHCALQDLA